MSLLGCNVGMEIGRLLVVAVVASALMALRASNEAANKRLAFGGSEWVFLAGTFWLLPRFLFRRSI